MKELIESLERSLSSRGKTFDITGKELIDIYNINEEQLNNFNNEVNSLLDGIKIEAPTKFIERVEKLFLPYNKEGLLHNTLICDVYRKRNKFLSLVEYVDLLKSISEDDAIKLKIKCLKNSYIYIYIENKNIVYVDFDEMNIDVCDIDGIKKLLYQLIILSYDVSLRETFKILNLL